MQATFIKNGVTMKLEGTAQEIIEAANLLAVSNKEELKAQASEVGSSLEELFPAIMSILNLGKEDRNEQPVAEKGSLANVRRFPNINPTRSLPDIPLIPQYSLSSDDRQELQEQGHECDRCPEDGKCPIQFIQFMISASADTKGMTKQ